ncbi:MAG: corrinoid protein [Anaerolineae bacterium]|nr:corrinoid protein [Anaerolineae bacterium]
MAGSIEQIRDYIIEGNKNGAVAAVEQALAEGISAASILNDAMISAMTEVGARFERDEYFVPEMLISARAMQAGMDKLRPLLVQSGVQPLATVAIGTVKGDLHDIGKNLVSMMLEGAGFAIKDLGVNVDPDKFVEAVREGADIVAMSALLTTTMANMKNTVEALKAAGVRDKCKIMIGGAPVTQTYSDEIGADGYSPDASSAARLARQLAGA